MRNKFIDNEGSPPAINKPLYENLPTNEYKDDIDQKHKHIIEVNQRVGGMFSGLETNFRDERTKRISIIRKTETKPLPKVNPKQ